MKIVQTKQRIKELEERGEFNTHIDETSAIVTYPVDENFAYVPKGFKKFKYLMQYVFVVMPKMLIDNIFSKRTKVKGKENLKGLKSAVVTCNHFYMFDCLTVRYALPFRKLRTTAAEFNNRRGFLGDMMRAGGMMPFSSNFKALKNMDKAITHYLNNKTFVLFYPEQAMWNDYKKPRPTKKGAYTVAVKNNVPILPMFITMKSRGKFDKDGNEKYHFIVNIGKPIYPKEELSFQENVKYLQDANFENNKRVYRDFYKEEI